jgi:ABC-type multidrug transport system ATPase subunit
VSTTQSLPSAGIVVRGVARSFGEVHALKDVTLDAPPGLVTALIGPNGSGKTTLLLMLASLLRPDAGSISIAGFDPITQTAAVRSRLGWMPDVLGSWNVLTVRAALEMTGRLYRLDKTKAASRAAELIALVGLEPLADRPTRVLSRGQKQKLSLARALVHDPDILLLDEPASGLDPVARHDLQLLVRQLASQGKTLLVSSHVLSELDEMADAAVYLENGVTVSADRIAQSKLAAREWRIRSLDVHSLRAALVDAGVGAESIGSDRGELSVPLSSDADAAALLTALVRAGASISSFAPAVGDLEHTFLDLSRASGEPTDGTAR